MSDNGHISNLIRTHEAELLAQWVEQQLAVATMRRDLIKEAELREQSRQFLAAFSQTLQSGEMSNILAPAWDNARGVLAAVSGLRARQGFSPVETAMFVFSLKQPLFDLLRQNTSQNGLDLVEKIGLVDTLLDKLGLFTTEIYQKNREEVIARQQQELLELSTPVVRLWEGVLALPLIGTLDSARTQVVMESLLTRIVETGAAITIIDITGVPAVDTLVAQHLLRTVAAARLMGADCIISGIRPQIAQTIVHLGVDLSNVVTKATLADAFTLALQQLGLTVTHIPGRG